LCSPRAVVRPLERGAIRRRRPPHLAQKRHAGLDAEELRVVSVGRDRGDVVARLSEDDADRNLRIAVVNAHTATPNRKAEAVAPAITNRRRTTTEGRSGGRSIERVADARLLRKRRRVDDRVDGAAHHMPLPVSAGRTDYAAPSERAGGAGRKGHHRRFRRVADRREDQRAHLESRDGEGVELVREVRDCDLDRHAGSESEVRFEDAVAASDGDRDVFGVRTGRRDDWPRYRGGSRGDRESADHNGKPCDSDESQRRHVPHFSAIDSQFLGY
jgi:hypothetical protein